MPSHYIKLLPFLQKYATTAGATLDHWASEVFADITHGGTYLLVRHLPPASELPRIALVGSEFYAEAGRDRDRRDALFITRIERAPSRHPTAPVRYEASCSLLAPSHPVGRTLDPVTDLFTVVEGTKSGEPEGTAPAAASAKPSPRLLALLRNCAPGVRSLFRPGPPTTPESDSAYVDAFRVPWRRHRLDMSPPIGVAQRTLGILNGSINPSAVSVSDRTAIASVFGIALLNKYLATRTHNDDEAMAFLEALAALPIRPSVRAALWANSIRFLPDSDLRRELYASARGMLAAAQDVQTCGAYEEALLTSITAARDAGQVTPAIDELLDIVADNAGNALTAIAQWATRLEVRDDFPLVVDATTREGKNWDAGEADSASKGRDIPALAVADPPLNMPDFDRWVLSFRFPDLTVLTTLHKQIGYEFSRAAATLGESTSIASLTHLSNMLSAFADHVQLWKRQLPSAEEIAADEAEARQLCETAQATLGSDLAEMFSEGVRPDTVREISEIMRYRECLTTLPSWAWSPQTQMPETPDGLEPVLWKRLLDFRVRRRALLISQLFKEFPDLQPRALAVLPQPSAGALIDEYVEDQVRQVTQYHARLKNAEPLHVPWINVAAMSGSSPIHIIECLDAIESVRDRVSNQTFVDIAQAQIEHAANPATLLAQSHAIERGVRFSEEMFATAEDLTYRQLQKLIEQKRLAEDPGAIGPSLAIQHNFIDRSAQRAVLQISESSGHPWGFIFAPLLLESDAAVDVFLRLEWTASSPWRDGWPSEWPAIEPSELRIVKLDWRPHSERPNGFLFSFKVCIPIRKPQLATFPKRLGLSLVIKSMNGRTDLVARDLEWTLFSPSPKTVRLDWQDTLNPNFVRQHPIGPQRDVDTMVERLRNGHSFAVLAPRRFGKSTLVEYLRSLNGEQGLVVASPVVCTRFAGSSGVDPAEFWRDISERVRAETGSPIDLFLEDALPRSSAFDAARCAIAGRGAQTLVLLFDEAQALFKRGPDGYHFGDRLKDAIEHSWSTRGEGMAGVAFVLVGLPGLLDRAGSNLMGALRPFKRSDIGEDDLNRLLLEVTQGALQTTRGARLRIASLSKNLLLLRELLERLVSVARSEGRTWVSTDDVVSVQSDLVRKLREGQEPAITRSLRDVFNDAETVNEWKPSPLYPIAVAISEARSEGLRSEGDLHKRVVEVLNAWAGTAGADYLKRITFEVHRIRESFRSLRDAGVLKDGEVAFVSPLLEAWLFGISRQGVYADEEFYPAMLSTAVARVRRPATMTPVDEGGQARLYRFSDGDELFAYREATIGSDEDRSRFVETVDALDEVMRRVSKRAPGSEYVFDLRAIGLRDDDDRVAVQVYRWIGGEDLSGRSGRLSPLAVAELGYQLAQAVAWLHGIGVIHRDLHPRNIVLSEETMRPVLIDFGLARLEGRVLKSAMASAFAAPEVRGPRPNWTKAADVWSMGALLEDLMRKEMDDAGSRAVLTILRRMQSEEVGRRPTSEELVGDLKRCAASLSVYAEKDEYFESVVMTALEKDGHVSFYSDTVRKFRPRFEAAYLGLFPSVIGRTAEAADFLNQLIEAWGKGRRGTTVSLGSVKRVNDITDDRLVCNEVEVLHQLRTARSHGTKQVGVTATRLGISEGECRHLVLVAAQRVGAELELGSLPNVVDAFFRDPSGRDV